MNVVKSGNHKMYFSYVWINFIRWVKWSRFEKNQALAIQVSGWPKTIVPKSLSDAEGVGEVFRDFGRPLRLSSGCTWNEMLGVNSKSNGGHEN